MMEPDDITALATVGLMLATFVTCFLIWRGIEAMNRSSAERAKDRREAREADLRRHNEAMDEGRRRHDEAMAALRALIERTGPAPAGRAGEAD